MLLMLSLLACQGVSESLDLDGDGVTQDGGDCDDNNAQVFPGAPERCDGLDNDCDLDVDENVLEVWYADEDNDGYGDLAAPEAECDPSRSLVDNPNDCDDHNPAIHPAAADVCDDLDNDCDRDVDEDPELRWYADGDGDGHGWAPSEAAACSAPLGMVADNTDCDDENGSAFPGGTEVCDAVDNNCDGVVDEGEAVDATWWYADMDADGYGTTETIITACRQPTGFSTAFSDCDDHNSAVHPGADELCDGIDNDCDGATTDDDGSEATAWYADGDGDGYGDPRKGTIRCEAPSGAVADDTDCDDSNAQSHPGAAETCDRADNDCDGDIDENVAASLLRVWFVDDDGDGHGAPRSSLNQCEQPAGYAATDTDCDDTDPLVNPDATEACDSADNDCDGEVDEAGAAGERTWYADSDGDGYGVDSDTADGCEAPSGYVSDHGDCDDEDGDTWPGAEDICGDERDNDCDGAADAGCPIPHCGTITRDETWAADEPHLVTCDVSVDDTSDPTLTIEDGAVVYFDSDTALRIGEHEGGTLEIAGDSAGVQLTSYEATPAAGDWDGIFIGDRAEGTEITGLTLEYAGSRDDSCLNIDAAEVILSDSVIRHCENHGIDAYSSSSLLEMTNTQVSDAELVGVYASGKLDGFTDNVLTDNGTYPISVPFEEIDELDDSTDYTDNGTDLVVLTSDNVTEVIQARLLGVDYLVTGNIKIGDDTGELEVAPGVTFYNEEDVLWTVGWSGDGKIVAAGTSTLPVTWTSAQPTPAPGDWKGIYIYYVWGSDTDLSGIVVEYGGDSIGGNIYCWASAPTIADSVIRYSSGYGINLSSCGSASISGITYTDNASGSTP